ncbi:glycosyltransferase [Solemya pervernicosa gill symbiont]|nr:hypothetical protein [Solemya pervernicosa gill symbiont]
MLYVHIDIDDEAIQALSKHCLVVPLFSEDPYKATNNKDDTLSELTKYLEPVEILQRELTETSPADLNIWPTLFGYQLSAFEALKSKGRIATCIHFPPNMRAGVLSVGIWRHGAHLVKKHDLDISFGVTVPELIPPYTKLLSAQINELPLLVSGRTAEHPKTELKSIGFFGQQKPGKGSKLIPELVQRLHRSGYNLTIQDSGNHMKVTEAPGLKQLSYVESLADEINKVDLVIAPYNPEHYRAMGSGVVWDAVASGVPIVAPAGTSPGNFISRHRAGVLFDEFTAQSVLEAVDTAHKRYDEIADHAFHACQNWETSHGIEKFVAALIAMGN